MNYSHLSVSCTAILQCPHSLHQLLVEDGHNVDW